MKNLFLLIFILSIVSCQDGPRAVFNEEFVKVNPKTELPFEKLIGEYGLDNDSKRRYGITNNDSVKLIIKKDSSFIAENYLDYKADSLLLKIYNGKLIYTNDFKDSFLYLRPKDNNFIGGGSFDIYYRKKDSVFVLYVYTPFIPATKENNMKYREGDYLRYIKVK
ncbi:MULTISPECIES: hypothetical protein [Chryseobacterium]|uniref:Uncharacterized protein n=1 Tax=Candidatus Chryseobacterium massiliense TaxID=204089 RepID=A0A3D9AEX4_9FLAO|nr:MULTISPECIES: hypothetical protein [Chryseobacterium]REC40004.1 hypothetical protein DRF68_20610 [Candidatus Chryseobacterium massiliae]